MINIRTAKKSIHQQKKQTKKTIKTRQKPSLNRSLLQQSNVRFISTPQTNQFRIRSSISTSLPTLMTNNTSTFISQRRIKPQLPYDSNNVDNNVNVHDTTFHLPLNCMLYHLSHESSSHFFFFHLSHFFSFIYFTLYSNVNRNMC